MRRISFLSLSFFPIPSFSPSLLPSSVSYSSYFSFLLSSVHSFILSSYFHLASFLQYFHYSSLLFSCDLSFFLLPLITALYSFFLSFLPLFSSIFEGKEKKGGEKEGKMTMKESTNLNTIMESLKPIASTIMNLRKYI